MVTYTKSYALALIEDHMIELETEVISARRFAVLVGNVLVDLVKHGVPWSEDIANAFELAAEACYMAAPLDDDSQEWLYRVTDRYEDLRP